MNVDGFVVASYDAALSQRSSHTATGAESLPELPPEEEAGGGGGRRKRRSGYVFLDRWGFRGGGGGAYKSVE